MTTATQTEIDVTLNNFLNWLSQQRGALEAPGVEFAECFFRNQGHRVSSVRFEGETVVVKHRYAYSSAHSMDAELAEVLQQLGTRRYWTVEEVRILIASVRAMVATEHLKSIEELIGV